jgi:hypothetical protein
MGVAHPFLKGGVGKSWPTLLVFSKCWRHMAFSEDGGQSGKIKK